MFRELVRRRNRLAWTLAGLMIAVHLGFILLIAFDGAWLGLPLGAGPITIGLPAALAVAAVALVLTAIYAHRANTDFDRMTRRLLEDLKP